MAFERPSIDTIYNRIKADMESRVTSGTRIPRFSLLGILAIVFAGAVHLLYGFLVWLSRQFFVVSADAEYLDNVHAITYNLPRKAATFAEGTVQFAGTAGIVIPEGVKLQNSEGFEYSTVSEVTIGGGGTVNADIIADLAGAGGNTDETSLQLSSPIAGVTTTVAVTVAPNGGQDLESTESLRDRLLQRIQNPPSSGTAGDYERWALEVAGVGRAWVLSASDYAGPGTVGIIVATSDLEPVDPAIKSDAQAYIDSVRPIGVSSTVEDVVSVSVTYDISITPDSADIRTAIEDNLTELHLTDASPGGVLLISRIRSAIGASGVSDYEITEIYQDAVAQGVGNVETTGFEVATFGGVTFAELV